MKCISNTDIEKGFSVSFKLGMDKNEKQEEKLMDLCVSVDFVFVLSSVQVS